MFVVDYNWFTGRHMLVSQKSRMEAWGMKCSSGNDAHLTVAIVGLLRKML